MIDEVLIFIPRAMGNMMMKYGGNIEELSALVKEEVNSRWELPGKESKDENVCTDLHFPLNLELANISDGCHQMDN